MDWREVEIIFDPGTEPTVKVTGQMKDQMSARGIHTVHLALAYTRTFATATAIAERG